MISIAALIGFLSLLGWVYLALLHGRFWQPLLADPAVPPDNWPSVDIIVPARDEAGVLPRSLPSLLKQDYPGPWRVILVDDHSDDGTGDLAKKIAAEKNAGDRLRIVVPPELAQGWSGKVAAMQAGYLASDADYILFTDADIEHPGSGLTTLVARAVEKKLDLASLMVRLHCQTFAEKLLIPAFVYFFAMLYPFSYANDPDNDVAAAAGGVMLVKRKALLNIGGLSIIRGTLIDDCALAKAIKHHGGDDDRRGRIELTLSADTQSLRVYRDTGAVWDMVARTAFTQLRHSFPALVGTVIGMGLLFLAPLLLPLYGDFPATFTGMFALFTMILLYVPMVRFYGLPFIWAITLPVAAIIYMGATIDSARLYWQGRGGSWKGRTQA